MSAAAEERSRREKAGADHCSECRGDGFLDAATDIGDSYAFIEDCTACDGTGFEKPEEKS